MKIVKNEEENEEQQEWKMLKCQIAIGSNAYHVNNPFVPTNSTL